MRHPTLPECRQRARCRHFPQAVGQAESVAHPEIVDRQNIRAAQLEHQQHLDGPAADATHLGKAGDDCLVRQRLQGIPIRDDSGRGLGGKILQGGDLRERQARGTQLLDGRVQDELRSREIRGRASTDKTFQDARGRIGVQLLIHDRP
ncbi:MAG TPA: hypothetical protein VKT26_04585, partial [Acetobacteraceae bacterium]|nr:hypothetical protein [Acetobacteraceae bacterium]